MARSELAAHFGDLVMVDYFLFRIGSGPTWVTLTFLLIVDDATRFRLVIFVPNRETETLKIAFTQWTRIFGWPAVLASDEKRSVLP